MKAIIYSRVSTLDQDNERQINELKEYAKYKKYTLVRVFQEKITGASKAFERTEFKNLLDLIGKEKIDVVLVWELSRLGRSMMDVLNTIENLSMMGINIYIKKEGMNTLDEKGKKSTMTTMLISILSGFAEMERETIRLRSISGIRQNVSKGGIGTGGMKPYGYTDKDGMLVIEEKEAKIVKLIYEKYQRGLGSELIASHLNQLDIKTKFNTNYKGKSIKTKSGIDKKAEHYIWRSATIYSILTNSIYCGERKHKSEIFDAPKIIEKSTFEKVQVMLSGRANKSDSARKHFNPFNSISLKCGKCGKSYFPHIRSNGRDKAYKCLSTRLTNKVYGDSYCGSPAIGYDRLIDSVYLATAKLINSDPLNKNRIKSAIENNIENKKIEQVNVMNELYDIEKQSENLIRLNINNKLSEKQFTKLNSEFTARTESLNARLIKINNDLDKLKETKQPKANHDFTKESLSTFLKDAVEEIKIFGVDVEKFKKIYPAKLEALVMVQIKSNPLWYEGEPIIINYMISRRSHTMSFVEIKKKTTPEMIEKGKIKIQYSLENFQDANELWYPNIALKAKK